MKKLTSCISTFLLFLLMVLYPLNARAEGGFMIGNIENAIAGSYVRLGGTTWRLIGDNYIMLNKPLDSMGYAKNGYASSDIRTYLNNDFLNKIGSDKKLISYNVWGIGTENFEYGLTISDKVSLPSYKDMQLIKDIFVKGNSSIWTRTQVSNSKVNPKFWSLNSKNKSLVQMTYSDKAAVYPVVSLIPDIVVTGRGTESNPYVINAIPGQTDETTVVGVKLDSTNINIKTGETYDLIPLFVYGDGTLKQVLNPNKYLYDKTLLTKRISLGYGVIVTGNKISYLSSNTEVAEVNSMGYVSGKKPGVSVITIKGLGWIIRGIVTVK